MKGKEGKEEVVVVVVVIGGGGGGEGEEIPDLFVVVGHDHLSQPIF